MRGPLDGIRVMDLTRVLSGPHCTMLLGDLGADVIKVEHPEGGDETRSVIAYPGRQPEDEDYFYPANRNKRSVAIDLKSPEGQKVALQLALACDVVIENFTPGVMDRLGLGCGQLRGSKPELIFCSISGFGQESPYRNRRAYDTIVQATAGLLSVTGEPGGAPLRGGFMFGDLSGSLYAAVAIVAALIHRKKTGDGQWIDIALADTLASCWVVDAEPYRQGGPPPQPVGDEDPEFPSGAFSTEDGKRIYLSVRDCEWPALAAAIGRPEWSGDPAYATADLRRRRGVAVKGALAGWVSEHPLGESCRILSSIGVPHQAVRNLAEVFEDPQVQSRAVMQQMLHPRSGLIRLIGSPLRLSGSPVAMRLPPPLLGQHTAEVLTELLGLSPAEIAALASQRAVHIA